MLIVFSSFFQNEKEWKKHRSENKHLTAKYKEVIPYKVRLAPAPSSNSAERNQCGECGRSYANQSRLAAHIRNVHKKKFKCKLCGDLFRTDGGLESHIGKSHMSLKTDDEVALNADQIQGYKEVLASAAAVEVEDPETSAWSDRSIYTCRECVDSSEGFPNREWLKGHLKSRHEGMTYAKYRARHGSGISVRVVHECLLCKKEVTHSAPALNLHLKKQHGLSKSQYYHQHTLEAEHQLC